MGEEGDGGWGERSGKGERRRRREEEEGGVAMAEGLADIH